MTPIQFYKWGIALAFPRMWKPKTYIVGPFMIHIWSFLFFGFGNRVINLGFIDIAWRY